LLRNFAKSLALGSLLLAMCAGNLQVTSAQPPQQDQARVRVHSDLVTLSVTVRNPAGNLVGDLKREQFRLLDDGVEQAITVFAEEKVPLSLIILIDNDVNGKEGVQMVQSLHGLLGGVSLEDQAMVCRFDMLFYPGEGFTSDLDQLMGSVKQAQEENQTDAEICSTTGGVRKLHNRAAVHSRAGVCGRASEQGVG
jgi:VWFA-related protein